MGQAVAGTCYIKVDGNQLIVMGAVEVPLSKVKRESLRPGYFKEEDVTPFVKLDALMTQGLDTKKLTTATNMTVTAELQGGRVYVLSGAYLVDDVTVSADDGKLTLKFEGINGDWQ